MYFPYFRGKQYELITIRETAKLLAERNFCPIIEPVREQINGLRKTLSTLEEAGADAIVIVNPDIGHHRDNGDTLVTFLREEFTDSRTIKYGVLAKEDDQLNDVVRLCHNLRDKSIALVHAGFADGKALAEQIARNESVNTSIFLEATSGKSGKLYQRHFQNQPCRVLVRDGFVKRRNKDHPDLPEFFSDLHITYAMENATSFGDFLIVGNEFSDSGGPAYTVAIHITFIDPTKDDAMMIQHFKSDDQETPENPAGKFADALKKLLTAVDAEGSHILNTTAIQEFRELAEKRHYPGLGSVKKLSMRHHIETLAAYFEE
jgi:hypothetical protein